MQKQWFFAGRATQPVSTEKQPWRLEQSSIHAQVQLPRDEEAILYIVTIPAHLRVKHITELDDCGSAQLKAIKDDGYDAVLSNEAVLSPTYGWVAGYSLSIFDPRIEGLLVSTVPAGHFDWPDTLRAVERIHESPELLSYQADALANQDPDRARRLRYQSSIRAGQTVVMSDEDWDKMVTGGMLDGNVCSTPNPSRVGLLDALVAGQKDCQGMVDLIKRNAGPLADVLKQKVALLARGG